MGIYYFPCEFVFWEKCSDHENLKTRIMNRIDRLEKIHTNNTTGLEGAYTSYNTEENGFLRNPKITEPVVYTPFRKMLSECNSRGNTNKITVDEIHISNAWYTKYQKGGYFNLHNHNDASMFINGKRFDAAFSLIYILNDENEKNSTEFFLPEMCTTSGIFHRDCTFKTGNVPGIKEGTVIIFPSSLYHRVVPSIKPGRVTIAYNLLCSFQPEVYVKLEDP